MNRAASLGTARSNMQAYAELLQDAHARLVKMEEHLAWQVQERRQRDARVRDQTMRIVSANVRPLAAGSAINAAFFKVPAGENWTCQRLDVVGVTTMAFVSAYRDFYDPTRLAQVGAVSVTDSVIGPLFSDSFSNNLWIKSDRQLIIVGLTNAGAQVSVLASAMQVMVDKPFLHQLAQEEDYALAEGIDEFYYEKPEDSELQAHAPEVPEDQREVDERESLGPLDQRPEPHFATDPTGDFSQDTPQHLMPMHGEEALIGHEDVEYR